ncbi:MAG: phosphoribosylamine--glycine ligase [Candidatus Latescibacter sp.]|nr:phosphoribosylamine--glycine ligase [Candidatus Latescibacter sp.]
MNILVVGGGGREHALAWKLAQSDLVGKLYAAPGNPGISEYAVCVPLKVEDVTGIAKFAVSESINLAAVGPEIPLCMGITDILEEAGIAVFGPSFRAAAIEGSKVFSKNLMRKYNIPTAAFEVFTLYDDAVSYARALGDDMWVKASGLAAGKGAVYASDPDVAERIIRGMMVESMFGESGYEVVIEDNMRGEEASIFAVCDGKTFKTLVSSQDHKRILDGDSGPNTGGMGAYAPAPVIDRNMMRRIEREIIQPTLDGMAAEGIPYRGLLYAGVMITASGPRVVEYNCRFGDPESQAVLPLLKGDLAEIMLSSAQGDLSGVEVGAKTGSALCVVMASGGYPGTCRKGFPVSGLKEAGEEKNVKVFHAGTALEESRIVTAGGRVLGVTAWSDSLLEARNCAYSAVDKISFQDAFYRKDIGYRALQKQDTEDRSQKSE